MGVLPHWSEAAERRADDMWEALEAEETRARLLEESSALKAERSALIHRLAFTPLRSARRRAREDRLAAITHRLLELGRTP